jgi:hypothetical protein
LSRRIIVLLLVAAAAAAALDAMGDATQTRPERVDLEARTRIELQVATKLHDGRPLRLAAESVWQACQWTVRRRLEAPGVRPIGGDRFELVVTPEAVRQRLIAMGYRWKRTRYAPSREPDPEEERVAPEELAELKRGPKRASTS